MRKRKNKQIVTGGVNMDIDDKEINVSVGEFEDVLEEINKSMDGLYNELSNLSISEESESTKLLKTGNPYLDVALCGGIPSHRMTYLWGVPGSGKTTLSFQIASSLFKRSILAGEKNKYVFFFLDSEEGVAQKWLNRIRLVVPFGKPIIPTSIEDIEQIIRIINNKFSDREIVVIWDSVAATPPKTVTGRGDTARAVSTLLRSLQLSSMNLTFLVINQFREKQDMFSSPEPPGGNFLRHKSHLTLYGKSLSKSKFFTKRPDAARSVLWSVQKARDAFVGVDFRLEMTQFSGFDAILGCIISLKELGIIEKKRGPYKIAIPKYIQMKYVDIDGSENEMSIDIDDFLCENVSSNDEIKFDDLKSMYKFFLERESYPYWKVMVKCSAAMMFRSHIFSDNDFVMHVNNVYSDIKDYYFSNVELKDILPTYMVF